MESWINSPSDQDFQRTRYQSFGPATLWCDLNCFWLVRAVGETLENSRRRRPRLVRRRLDRQTDDAFFFFFLHVVGEFATGSGLFPCVNERSSSCKSRACVCARPTNCSTLGDCSFQTHLKLCTRVWSNLTDVEVYRSATRAGDAGERVNRAAKIRKVGKLCSIDCRHRMHELASSACTNSLASLTRALNNGAFARLL
ncbi:hypothetical protein Mapa_008241 [Marchantia paleacea]|nr:hypothetical protein Mapa_008241 [Marchantia paleacea]